MNYLDFTAEESALIAIYADGTRTGTLAAITATLPNMDAVEPLSFAFILNCCRRFD